MKILLAIRSLNFGGAERQFVLLTKELHKRGEELLVVLMYRGGTLEGELENIPIAYLDKKGLNPIFLKRYREIILQFKPQIIYSFLPEMNIFSILCAKKSLNIQVIWGFRSSDKPLASLSFGSKIYLFVQKLLSSKPSAIVCNSYHALKYHRSIGYCMTRGVVVENGIDTQMFYPNPTNKESMRQEIGVPVDAKVFGIVARMDFVKGYVILAKAAKEVLSRYENVYFVSVGKINESILQECRLILGELSSRFIFLGAKAEVFKYYNAFDFVVSSSLSESFSNSIAEAMACGIPCIVTNVGDSANIVGDCGIVVSSSDEVKLSVGLQEALKWDSETYKQLSKQSRVRIEENFSVSCMVQKTLEVFENSLGRVGDNKPNLAIFLYSMGSGGAERVVSLLIPGLQEHYKVYLVLLENIIHYSLPKNLPILILGNNGVYENPLLKLIKLPLLAYKYHSFLKNHCIKLSFSLMSRPNYINVLSSFLGGGVKTFISERSFPSKQYKDGLSGKINRFLIRHLYNRAYKVSANASENAVDLYKNFNIKREIKVLHNPFDVDFIHKSMQENTKESQAIEQKKGEGYFCFISIGRLDKGKNHQLLIKALAQADQKSALFIVGEGELRGELETQIKELGMQDRVFLTGRTNNPYAPLARANCFVFASLSEGFPNVLVESLIVGTPIICTNCAPRAILDPKNEWKEKQGLICTPLSLQVPLKSDNLVGLMAQAMQWVINGDVVFNKDILRERGIRFDLKLASKEMLEFLECDMSPNST